MDIFIEQVGDIKVGKAGAYFMVTAKVGSEQNELICKETEWQAFVKGQESKMLHGFEVNEKYVGKFYLEKEGGKKVAEEAPKSVTKVATRDDTTNKSIEAQVACKAGTEIWCKHIEGDKPIDSKSLSGQVIKATAQYILEKLGHEATVDKAKEEP